MNRWLSAPLSLLENVRRRGLRATVVRALHRGWWRYREWRWGVQTTASLSPEELGHRQEHYGYQPVDPQSLTAALTAAQAGPDDVFLDIGCGLGRALLIAADRPLRRVVGLEYCRDLHAAAQRNVAAAQPALRAPVEVLQGDATSFAIPDDVTIVFMFNPFGGQTLQAVVENVRASLERAPRRLTVLYSTPRVNENALDEVAWLRGRTIATPHAEWERLRIYRADLPVAARLSAVGI